MTKLIKLASLTAAVFLFSFCYANIDDVVNALKAGNASGISKFFDNTVEITLPGKSNTYSRSQAEVILTDFFNNNPVKSFEVLHKGENAGSEYCIGILNTRTASYRTTVFMKQKDGKHILQEIRFETQ